METSVENTEPVREALMKITDDNDVIKRKLETIIDVLVSQRVGTQSRQKAHLKRRHFGSHLSDASSSNSSFSSNSSERLRLQETIQKDNNMKDAIQYHITDLVDTLPFDKSDIPDQIIVHGIAIESESASLRNLKTTEDQISGLISLVITRDYSRMDKFLKIVNDHSPDVVGKIREMHNSLSEVNDGASIPCIVCELKAKCDIKRVYNHFFAKKMISTSLHRRIAHLQCLTGDQNGVWDYMLDELAKYPNHCVIDVFLKALEHEGAFNTSITQMLQRLLRKNRSLRCRCDYRISAVPQSENHIPQEAPDNHILRAANSHIPQVLENHIPQTPVSHTTQAPASHIPQVPNSHTRFDTPLSTEFLNSTINTTGNLGNEVVISSDTGNVTESYNTSDNSNHGNNTNAAVDDVDKNRLDTTNKTPQDNGQRGVPGDYGAVCVQIPCGSTFDNDNAMNPITKTTEKQHVNITDHNSMEEISDETSAKRGRNEYSEGARNFNRKYYDMQKLKSISQKKMREN